MTNRPKPTLEHNTGSCHESCFAPAAPSTRVAHQFNIGQLKASFTVLLMVTALVFAGCASLLPEKGGVFYEVSSDAVFAEVIAKAGALKQALRADGRFEERIEQGFAVRCAGANQSSFAGFWVSVPDKAGSGPTLVIACPYRLRTSTELTAVRQIVDSTLGEDLVHKLQIEIRYSPFM
jgi:hypothetical protein